MSNDATKILELLQKFECAWGQQVNSVKSSIFFSSNALIYNMEDVCNILQMSEADDHISYLGLANILGRNKSVILGFLKEKVRKRIENWDRMILQEEV